MSTLRRLALAALLLHGAGAPAAELSIFDGHIHYNADAASAITPDAAIHRLKSVGITRAPVSAMPVFDPCVKSRSSRHGHTFGIPQGDPMCFFNEVLLTGVRCFYGWEVGQC